MNNYILCGNKMAEELEKVGAGKRLIDGKLTLIQQKELKEPKEIKEIIVPAGMLSDEDKKAWLENHHPGGILQYIPFNTFNYKDKR